MELTDKNPLLVVGLGASAGGLAALQEFFTELPPAGAQLAYVVVQHLSPGHKSLMAELLTRTTTMTVKEAQNGDLLQPGTIYINPPARYLSCKKGCLQLSESENHPLLPIDYFFRSLAKDTDDRAVAIILSGTGNDGAHGVVAVKDAGGLVMVQDESSAEYAGMPRASIGSGASNFVLPPGHLARQLVDYLEHRTRILPPGPGTASADEYHDVLQTLEDKVAIDFSQYKKESLLRRIRRRMAVRQTDSLDEYDAVLRADPQEARVLLRDILIGVTRFFRDSSAFASLSDRVVAALVAGAAPGEKLRVWVPACSTGEEAYSIAILFMEQAAVQGRELQLKVFATDLERDALQTASRGFYSDAIASDVSSLRLQRYFVQSPGGYTVAKAVRERVVFSVHNLVKDPPFTNLDLVSCRNLLIYFEPELQTQALSFMHFALKPARFLFLGASESTDGLHDVFLSTDSKWNIYQKLGVSPGLYRWPTRSLTRPALGGEHSRNETALAVDEGYRRILEDYCPPTILVDASGKLLHTLVAADRYLKTHPGAARLELSSLLAPRLGAVVVSALHQCMREPAPVENGNETDNGVREFVAPETDTEHLVGVKVRPLLDSRGERRFALISFRDRQPSAPATESALTNIDIDQETQHQLQQMRQEVQIARENFQTTVEELETTNEELQATNEELMASGQEFETTGEQVRQDLASANEELIALTSEHQSRIDELNEANADLESLLSSTRQAVLFLDEQLQILRFSPGVAAFMHLMDRDIGRPIEHISGIFHDPEFLAGARLAASQGQSFERHLVSSDSKTTFRVKMHPYLCRPGKRGVVITFKNSEEERGTVSVQDLLDSLEGSVAVVKRSGEVERVNNAWRLLAADSLPAGRADWPGLNLLHCLRGWGDEACRAADGLIQALQDGLATSDWEYTRLQESERRSYRMTMRRLSSLAPGAIITHLDTTPARQIELV